MEVNKLVCDRCGAEIKNINNRIIITAEMHNFFVKRKDTYDLCKECEQDFLRFMEGKDGNKKQVIKALRCSSMPYTSKTCNCSECPYRYLEEVTEEHKAKGYPSSDIVIDGKEYWESCDCDRLLQDAAYLLEKGI